ncbi:MAG: hypothetical protein CL927_05745 [Deltaproteobacteria bacterium]|nr:hypothetical protein [Deltaproteobacteria bacterium]
MNNLLKPLMSQLKTLADTLQRSAVPFDPSLFGDPIAERADWTPLVGGGTNIGTHWLKQQSAHRLVFAASWGARLFAGIFIAVGLTIMVGALLAGFAVLPMPFEGVVGGLLFGGIFLVAGGFAWRKMCAPRVFDKRMGAFFRGSRPPAQVGMAQCSEDHVPFSQIHALQIIRERVHGKNTSFYSYELNLVLKDAARVNVVDHSKVVRLRREAEELAGFLGVPVWDASQ